MSERRSRAPGTPAAGRARPVTGAVTLKQVAAEADVSLATASRVLHNSGGRAVRGALEERVRTAAERLGYVSNPHAQALARARSSTVGLIVHDVTDPYFAAIAAGAMHAAHAEGVMVMMAATFRDAGLELDYFNRLRAQGARGVVLAGSGGTDARRGGALAGAVGSFVREGGRVVSIGARPGMPADAVVPANAAGARLAIEHLRGLGHREIGVISGPDTLLAVRDRLAGIGPGVRVEPGDFSRESGEAAARRLLAGRVGRAAGAGGGITALLALDDPMAAGALTAAADLGLRVPADLSVVGFDDVPFAADLNPALTTVRLPLVEMGEQAMRLLLTRDERPGDERSDDERAGAGPAEQVTVEFPAELVVRASSGPAPRG